MVHLSGQTSTYIPPTLDPPPGSFETPFPGRFFVDLFAGRNAPIFHACRSLQIDTLEPLDIEQGWDILNDVNFEKILHAAWNGFIGGLWCAPPCREYSRLKLKRPGPKPLRTPLEPYGRQDLTVEEWNRLQTEEEIHSRGRTILQAAHNKGALVGWETPPTAMTLLLTENTDMLRDWNATCSHVAACQWGMPLAKSWLMCANDAEISSLAGRCQCSSPHPSFAGIKTAQGGYLSAQTAEYPPSLAMAVAQIMTKRCSTSNQLLSASQGFFRNHPQPSRKMINDGGGLPSSADWSVPHRSDRFEPLRNKLFQFGKEHGLIEKALNHLHTQAEEAPLTPTELNPLKQIFHQWALEQGISLDWSIPQHQHFRLHLLQVLSNLTQDPDVELHYHLQHGVPTGVLDPIPPSYIWPKKPQSELPNVQLQSFDSNWSGANENPQLTWSLIEEELKQGWIEEIPGGLLEAQQRWQQCAVGKLNVVQAPGRKPRLVLDSSCCGVNQQCALPETMILPTVDDVRSTLHTLDCGSSWTGLSLDIRAAHKQIRLRESDRGLVMFSFQSRFFAYRVAHFGARFSAYWWSRLGALLLRLLHQFLGAPHKAWLYVDDLMLWAPNGHFQQMTWTALVFLMLLGTPISWQKAQIGTQITWIGWIFDLQCYTVQLVDDKVQRILQVINEVVSAKTVAGKTMEQLLGMLIWFTAIAKHLRPHLAPLYKNLYAPPATLFSIPAASWSAFVDSLDQQGIICKSHPHFAFPMGGRVVEIGHQTVRDKLDVPTAPKTSKLQWVRIRTPMQGPFTLTTEVKKKLKWFSSIMTRASHIYPLAFPTPTIMRAAADAFADNESFGIGGWIITSKSILWFSEQYCMSELRLFQPQLTKDAQKYISAFEVLAQLALLMAASDSLHFEQMQVCLPASSDNTSAESSINRQLSTKEPSASFLQWISQWAYQRQICLQISHIPGKENSWADDLSRDRLNQWLSYPRYRVSMQDFFNIGRVVKLHPPGPHPPWLQTLTQHVS